MYIGELVRLCLLTLTDRRLLFGGKVTDQLSTRWVIQASVVAAIERYVTFDLAINKYKLRDM
jgi:hexokinase